MADAARHGQEDRIDAVDMDGAGDRIVPESLPASDVGLELVWMGARMERNVVSDRISDVEGAGTFEGDREEIGHVCECGKIKRNSILDSIPQAQAAMAYEPTSPSSLSRRLTSRTTMNDRRSVNAFFSIAAEQDVEVEDDLARGAHPLRHL